MRAVALSLTFLVLIGGLVQPAQAVCAVAVCASASADPSTGNVAGFAGVGAPGGVAAVSIVHSSQDDAVEGVAGGLLGFLLVGADHDQTGKSQAYLYGFAVLESLGAYVTDNRSSDLSSAELVAPLSQVYVMHSNETQRAQAHAPLVLVLASTNRTSSVAIAYVFLAGGIVALSPTSSCVAAFAVVTGTVECEPIGPP